MVGPTALGLETLRFHDLRHATAAFLIAAGAHPGAIMERLGHSSITVTIDTYGHLLRSLDDELTDALEARFQSTPRDDLRGVCGAAATDIGLETGRDPCYCKDLRWSG